MILRKNLSNSIKFIKASRHLSITELSEKLGIARSSLQAILKGTSNPRIDTIEYIADRLHLNPLLLLSSKESYTDSAILIAEILQAVSHLEPAEKQKFLSLFQELVLLLDKKNPDT